MKKFLMVFCIVVLSGCGFSHSFKVTKTNYGCECKPKACYCDNCNCDNCNCNVGCKD